MFKIVRFPLVLLILFGTMTPVSLPAGLMRVPSFVIHADRSLAPVTGLMLGSNAPSWLAPERFNNATFRARTKYSGLRTLRIPGGSWSNMYGWLSCEMRTRQRGNSHPCGVDEDWSAWIERPSDYINFLRATNQKAVYTLNVNATAQESAALVAFFNGDPADSRVIGVDRFGQDWKTVGNWAQLRVTNGNPRPFYVKVWEVGNEVYGAKQSTGGQDCASYGWENAWTCDGEKYINGDATHDGYRQIRAAMQVVDPTILVGAVGNEDPQSYNNWGIKVVQQAGSYMDFYVVHPYTYGTPPVNNAVGWAQVLAAPRQKWPAIKTTLQTVFNQYAGGRKIPIAANEFNLTYSHELDTQKMMRTVGNMLFIAETFGQAISRGYFMANQWDLSNGCSTVSGSCYDMLLADYGFSRSPQYYAMPLWGRFGNTMLQLDSEIPTNRLSAYAARIDAGTYSILVINKTSQTIAANVQFSDHRAILSGTADAVRGASFNAASVTFNGKANVSNDLSNAPPLPLTVVSGQVRYNFPPYAITLLRMNAP